MAVQKTIATTIELLLRPTATIEIHASPLYPEIKKPISLFLEVEAIRILARDPIFAKNIPCNTALFLQL